jgi:hypothetical protein
MQRLIWDIEVYPNYVLVGYKSFKEKKYYFFEFSNYHNDIIKLKAFLKDESILIGFNSIHYDNLILSKILTTSTDNIELFLRKIKETNDDIIRDDYDKIKHLKYNKAFKSHDIDLYSYWSKMLRLSKKISLKGLMVQLNLPLVQELPYTPSTELTKDEMEIVKNYNINDLDATEALTLRMENDIKLRFSIKNERDFDCLSWDAIKLASEELLKSYCDETESDLKDTRKLTFEKPTIYINKLLKDINFDFKTEKFKTLLKNLYSSVNTFKEKILFSCNKTNILLSYGIGGIHTVNKNQSFKTDSKYQLLTSDIASLYPTIIENYKLIRFVEVLKRYTEIKKERLLAKHGKLENKNNSLYNKFYKLVLNGVSGLLDNTYSWLYYPEGAMKLRLMGQLILTKLIENVSLNGFEVVSANTDGIEVLVEHEKLDEYYKIVNEVETQFNVIFEHELYDRIFYWSVNDYLAVVEQPDEMLALDKLKIKQKGMMVTNPELGNSVDSLIIPKALNYYFIYGVPVEETIKNEKDIYLFCNAPKVDKKFTVWWANEKQQRLNRFYVSNDGQYLYKQKRGGNLENMLKGYLVIILNDNRNPKTMEQYNVNHAYYVKKCNELIEDIEPSQLKLF